MTVTKRTNVFFIVFILPCFYFTVNAQSDTSHTILPVNEQLWRNYKKKADAEQVKTDALNFESKKKNAIKKYGKKYGILVLTGQIQIGMPERIFIVIKGNPLTVNRTVTASSVFEQWIYDGYDKREYYYFTNGKLTSWQD